jgi:UDP-GlcNAc:undecaprenyl-phosphate GlcNAc-1-phosphate transferase
MVTILWYVVVFNAVNFSDWVPGLTGGFALISFIILACLAIKLYLTDRTLASQENSRFLLSILAIIIPITYFLTRADISRQVIMWDSGTIILAFLIATLAIIAGGKIATAISVLGLYLIDFVYVITARMLKWQNPMKWDQTHHLHFRLMELGLTQPQIRFIVYFLSSVFGIAAIFLPTIGKIILFVIIAGITIFLTEILEKVRKK